MTKEQWRYEFSFRLRKRMKRKGYNQRQLAELTGLSEVTLSRYINGVREPSSSVVYRIAKVLNCTVDELVAFDEMTESGKYYCDNF